jgi:hypothetical protein
MNKLCSLATCGANEWDTHHFSELLLLIREICLVETTLKNRCTDDEPLLILTRSKMPIYLLFEKATSKYVMPFEYENQLEYELADVEITDKCIIRVSQELEEVYFARIAGVIALIEQFCFEYPAVRNIYFSVALGDLERKGNALAFSSAANDELLIPDPYFIITRGYQHERSSYGQHVVPWSGRIDRAYWRGATSGAYSLAELSKAPRIALALASKRHENLFDVSIVAGKASGDELFTTLEAWGVLGEREPQERILDFKYQIDIDGFSNAWVGFFLKLLTGSPVLKVKSKLGYRQWYYDKLNPWVNYVPVQSDLSDLVKNVEVLRDNALLAEAIGREGRELALGLTYESQLSLGAAAIRKSAKSKLN